MHFAARYYLHQVESHPQVGSFQKENIKIAISFDQIFNRSVRLSDFIALSTGDVKKMAQASTKCLPKNILFASEIQVQTISHDNKSTSSSEQENAKDSK